MRAQNWNSPILSTTVVLLLMAAVVLTISQVSLTPGGMSGLITGLSIAMVVTRLRVLKARRQLRGRLSAIERGMR